MSIKIENEWFIDEAGRRMGFRGINLSGSSKVPYPNGETHLKTDFLDHRTVSFIGRPFPLEEADEHFTRLKGWGINFIRFVVTWEAIEHAGPKVYDLAYINYVKQLLKKATETYGFYVMIDPHQDVWSRMTGGDGAPGWVFEKFGMDLAQFHASDCSWTMQQIFDPAKPDNYPPQYWTQNKFRYPCASMFTLFFGGNEYAPNCNIDGIPAQEYLQNHYIEAFTALMKELAALPKVIGISPMNEPYSGWIGLKADLSNFQGLKETLGYSVTPFDAMCIASGITRTVGYRMIKKFGIKEVRKDPLNPNKISIWLPGHSCIWKNEGIWQIGESGEPILNKMDHFLQFQGHPVDFLVDCYIPFVEKFITGIRKVMPNAFLFLGASFEDIIKGNVHWDLKGRFSNVVNAPSWYDVASIGTNKPMLMASFDIQEDKPVLGKDNTYKMFVRQLKFLKENANRFFGGAPTIITEFNLPFAMNNGKAYEEAKNNAKDAWKSHLELFQFYYDAMDDNLLNSVFWNYCATNSNKFGDGWNLEDFSIFCKDQQKNPGDINSGGRAIEGFSRPYWMRCAGIPKRQSFNTESKEFLFEFDGTEKIKAPTMIFLPPIQYPGEINVQISPPGGTFHVADSILSVEGTGDGLTSITIRPTKI
jgi:hypothetical protein